MKPAAIRALRDRLQMDQLEFAHILGLTNKQRVSRLEHGHHPPRGPLAQLLALYARHPALAQEAHARRQAENLQKNRKTG